MEVSIYYVNGDALVPLRYSFLFIGREEEVREALNRDANQIYEIIYKKRARSKYLVIEEKEKLVVH